MVSVINGGLTFSHATIIFLVDPLNNDLRESQKERDLVISRLILLLVHEDKDEKDINFSMKPIRSRESFIRYMMRPIFLMSYLPIFYSSCGCSNYC